MKVIVTGGAGFIGSHIVDTLLKAGDRVIVIDNLSTGKRENINPKARFYKLDVCDFKKMRPLFRGVDYVFHTAALARIQTSIRDPLPAHNANATGTLNVLLAARDAEVKKVIYSASSSAYGPQKTLPYRESMICHPQNPYAIQKFLGELYCKSFSELYGLPTVCLRYFNVYGPRQITRGAYATVVGIFLWQRRKGQPMTVVKDGRSKRRDYTHVSDVVRGNLLAMKNTKVDKGEVINLGTGRNYSVVEVARLIGGPYTFIPKRLGEVKATRADFSKARRLLGWQPTISFEEGIQKLKEEYGLLST